MSFDWTDYYNLAAYLRDHAPDTGYKEAALRSAISRAYYSSFCLARKYLRERHGLDPTGSQMGEHAFVSNWFRKNQDPSKKKIGASLERLKGWRNQADYQDEIASLMHTFQVSIDTAGQIIVLLKQQ